MIPLYRPDSKPAVLALSPSGKVPALRHGDLVVWDSAAICEHLAETLPQERLWPEAPAARAVARAFSAEMHSGFAALRRHLPMDLRAPVRRRALPPEVAADVDRVTAIWQDCRRRFGGGDFLFGRFSIADAMYAPVATRFRTYGVAVAAEAQAYCDRLLALPAMQQWCAAARGEPWAVPEFDI